MSSELTVVIKDDEKTLRTKYIVYEPYSVDEQDPVIKKYVEQCIRNFDGTPTDVIVKINLIID